MVEPLDTSQGYLDPQIGWLVPTQQPVRRIGLHPSVRATDYFSMPLDISQGYVDISTKFDFYRPIQQPTYRKGHHPAIYGQDRTTQPIKEDIEFSVSQFMDWYRPVSVPAVLTPRRSRSLSGFFEVRPVAFTDTVNTVAASMTWHRPTNVPYRQKVLPRLFNQQYLEPIQPNIPVILSCRVYSTLYLQSDTDSNVAYAAQLRSDPAQ